MVWREEDGEVLSLVIPAVTSPGSAPAGVLQSAMPFEFKDVSLLRNLFFFHQQVPNGFIDLQKLVDDSLINTSIIELMKV